MQQSRTTLYHPKLNLNPHSRNTLFKTIKMVKKGTTGMTILYKTPLGEARCSGNHFLFHGCLSIQFFVHSSFPNTVRLPLVTYPYLCSTCVTYGSMPHHWSPSAHHPTLYLGKQRIFLGVAIILSMCLCPHT